MLKIRKMWIKRTISVASSALMIFNMLPSFAYANDPQSLPENILNVNYVDEVFKSEDFSSFPDELGEPTESVYTESVEGDYALAVEGGAEANILAQDEMCDIFDGSVATGFASGDGSEENPYIIRTGSQLAYLAKKVNEGETYSGKYFKLTKNLDLNNKSWTPIGWYNANIKVLEGTFPFAGTFDGDNHIIKNVFISEDWGEGTGKQSDGTTVMKSTGLFGFVTGTIKNLGVDTAEYRIGDSSTETDRRMRQVGGLCGATYGALLENCYTNNVSIKLTSNVGSIAGVSPLIGSWTEISDTSLKASTLKNCYTMNFSLDADGYLDGGGRAAAIYNGFLVGCFYEVSGNSFQNCFTTGYKENGEPDISVETHPLGRNWKKAKTDGFYYCVSTEDVLLKIFPETSDTDKAKYYPDGEEGVDFVTAETSCRAVYVTEEELKNFKNEEVFADSFKAAFSEDTFNQNGGYPCFSKYSVGTNDKVKYTLSFYPESGAVYSIGSTDLSDNAVLSLKGANDELMLDGEAFTVNENAWNTLEVTMNFDDNTADVELNGEKKATQICGDSYGQINLEVTEGRVLVDDASFGTDYTDELTAAYNALTEYTDTLGFDNYSGGESFSTTVGGYSVNWSVDDEDIISADGSVVYKDAYEQKATVTAELTLNNYSSVLRNAGIEVRYEVVVQPLDSASDTPDNILNVDEVFKVEDFSSFPADLGLPTDSVYLEKVGGERRYALAVEGGAEANILAQDEVYDIFDGSVATGFASGDGSVENPYIIRTGSQLAYLAKKVNEGETYAGKYFKLTKNLDLNNKEWTPIGSYDCRPDQTSLNGQLYFAGTFDGNNHIIKNIYVSEAWGEGTKLKKVDGISLSRSTGLFGFVANGTVKNLGIDTATYRIGKRSDGNASDMRHVGGLAGATVSAIIENCYTNNVKVVMASQCGAIQGVSPLIGSWTELKINTSYKASTIKNCYTRNFSLDIDGFIDDGGKATSIYCGFLVGSFYAYSSSSIKDCYTTGFSENGAPGNDSIATFPIGVNWKKAKFDSVYYNAATTGCDLRIWPEENAEDEANYYPEGTAGTDFTLMQTSARALYVTLDELKNFKTSDKFTDSFKAAFSEDTFNQNGGYPCFSKYSVGTNDKVKYTLSFYPESGAVYSIGSTDLSDKVVLSLEGANGELMIDGKAFAVNENAWNTLEVTMDFANNTAIAEINGKKKAIQITGESYGQMFLKVAEGRVLVDDASFGTDYTDELTAAYDALIAYTDTLGFDNYLGGEAFSTTVGGYDYIWSVSDEGAISADGSAVTRRAYNQKVTVTAKMTLNDYSAVIENAGFEANFDVIIPALENVTDEEKLAAMAQYYITSSLVTDEEADFITKSLKKLPDEFDGVSIEWSSGNTDVIDADGKVTLPYDGDGETVELTAALSLNGETVTKTIPLTVMSCERLVQDAVNALDYSDLTSEEPTLIKNDLYLFKKGLYGTSISWESSDTDLISPEGFITKGDTDETVTVTATVSLNGYSLTKPFYFNVDIADTVKLERDAAQISFASTEVYEDFNVPLQGSLYQSEIAWSSSSSAISLSSGKAIVKRPSSDSQNEQATLTATLKQGDSVKVLTFDFTVLRSYTDAELVQMCTEWLTWDNINASAKDKVTENFSLPKLYREGVEISWVCDKPEVVDAEGILTRPDVGAEDVTATLTATITKNELTETVPFTFTVAAFFEAEEVLAKAASELTFAALSNQQINMVSENIVLPLSWRYQTTVSWQSTNTSVINPADVDGTYTGVVTRPDFGNGNKEVVLTAILSYNGEIREKRFYITVAEYGGSVSLYYQDFESESDGLLNDSEWNYNDTLQPMTVINDPTQTETPNKVVKWTRGPDDYTSSLETTFTSSETVGEFDYSFDFCFVSIPDHEFRVRTKGAEYVVMNIMPDFSLTVSSKDNYVKSTKENAFALNEWHNIRIHYDTINRKQVIYLDGENLFGELDVLKPSQPNTKVTGFLHRFNAGSNEIVNEHCLYLDNISFVHHVDYSEYLAQAYSDFEIGFMTMQNLNAVTEDLKFPDVSLYETEVSYESSDPAVISSTGAVTRGSEDKNVTFTANFSNRWGGKRSRVFNIIVKAAGYGGSSEEGSSEDVDAVLSDVEYVKSQIAQLHTLTNITGDMSLPTAGPEGSTVTYVSSNPDVVSDTGKVTRGSGDTTVTLRALVQKGSVGDNSAVFTLTVKAKMTVTSTDSGSVSVGSSSSSGGSSSTIPGVKESPVEEEKALLEEDKNASATGSFSDVPTQHWAYEPINTLYEKGIINGVSDTEFRPEAEITREEFLKLIVLLSGCELESNATVHFEDAAPDAWYIPYIAAAYNNGLTQGIGNNLFGIGNKITRQDMCVMVYNLLKDKLTADAAKEFADGAHISAYAKTAVESLYAAGIVNGKADGSFYPLETLTRAQAAQVIYNIVERKLV